MRLILPLLIAFLTSANASAILVQGEFSGTVSSNVISGKFTYDTEVTPVFPN